jgi:hypothetical protein
LPRWSLGASLLRDGRMARGARSAVLGGSRLTLDERRHEDAAGYGYGSENVSRELSSPFLETDLTRDIEALDLEIHPHAHERGR